MTPEQVRARAEELIGWIKERWLTGEGLVSRLWPSTGRTLFDNLDDLCPFLLHFGEHEFLAAQARRIRELGHGMLSLCTEFETLTTRNIDEWFGGLWAVWRATGEPATKALLDESMHLVGDKLLGDGFLSAAYFPDADRAASYQEPWSSGLLECFCAMRSEYPDAFRSTRAVINAWLAEPYFRRHHLFPYRFFRSPLRRAWQGLIAGMPAAERASRPLAPKPLSRQGLRETWAFFTLNGQYSQMMKSNSTCAFTLLELYRLTGQEHYRRALEHWIGAALSRFCEEGKVWMEYYPRSGLRREPGVVPAFILVDVICDSAYFLPGLEDRLPAAREILDHHWARRLPEGLIPQTEGARFAHLDSQVDFSISLRRYGELSGREEYRHRSRELMEATLERHYTPDGYATFSGEHPNTVIDVKYNGLLLKGMINLLTMDRPIYPELHELFKDR